MTKSSAGKILGRNVGVVVNGDLLTLTIDLSAKTQPSGSGKTMIVASTEGNKAIDERWRVGLNVYEYAEKKKKVKK